MAFTKTFTREDPSFSRMSKLQLSMWLAKGNGEWRWKNDNTIHTRFSYLSGKENESVSDEIIVRPFVTNEWIEPTVDLIKEN